MVRPSRRQIQAGNLSGLPARIYGKITAWTDGPGRGILGLPKASHEHDHRHDQSRQDYGRANDARNKHPVWDLLLTFGRKSAARSDGGHLRRTGAWRRFNYRLRTTGTSAGIGFDRGHRARRIFFG